MGVKQQQKRVAMYRAPFCDLFLGWHGRPDAYRASGRTLPVFIGHLMSIREEPGDVLDFTPTDTTRLEELSSVQHRLPRWPT